MTIDFKCVAEIGIQGTSIQLEILEFRIESTEFQDLYYQIVKDTATSYEYSKAESKIQGAKEFKV